MGTVHIELRQLSNGMSYRLKYRDPDIRDDNGVMLQQSLTFHDRAEAEKFAAFLNANNCRLGPATDVAKAIEANVPTVTAMVTEHIAHLTGIEEQTRKDYRRILRQHITPHLGLIPCNVLTRDRSRLWVNDLAATGMSPKTLKNVHALLSAAFTWAIEEREWRPNNPVKGIKLPAYNPPEMTFLTPTEFAVFVSQFAPPYRDVVYFLGATGVRWGELIALTVGDIHLDVDQPYVSINKAVKRTPGGHYVGAPKSHKSRRLVALSADLVDTIRPHLLHPGSTVQRPSDALLFRGPKGGRLHHGNFRDRQWKRAVEAATATHDTFGEPVPPEQRVNQPWWRIHDMRHSHASWLIAAGLDLHVVQRRLGHESITTTVDRYGHLDPGYLKRAAAALDVILGKVMSPPDLDPLDPLAGVIDLAAARDVRRGSEPDDPAPGTAPGVSGA